MNPAFPFDPELHDPGSVAARGGCSWHGAQGGETTEGATCQHEAVVSFEDAQGRWQSGCQRALENLVARGAIEPLGQGA
jgi:hypothetical protein